MPDASLTEIETKLRSTAQDPFRFDELIETWNTLFDAYGANSPEESSAQVERIVDTTFAALGGGDDDQRRTQLQRVINGLPHAALMVRADGIVIGVNEAALERLPIDPGDRVEDIGYDLERDVPLASVIAKTLNRRNGTPGEVALKRAVHKESDRAATLAIVPSHGPEAALDMVLLFVIDPIWRAEVEAFMARAYELTSAEARVLMGFLDGNTLQDVAAERGTSYATVRTQFQTVMTKTGARSQAELMRNTLAVSQFYTDVKQIASVAVHPYRKRIDLFRPGGRSVDVTLAGDFNGELVVYIPDTTQCTFQPSIEAAFRQAGLCVASLCRPGLGRTDPPVLGQDYETCLAEDIAAFQDQYGVKRAAVLAHNSSSSFAYRVGGLIPERITRVIVVSSLVPKMFMRTADVGSPWVAALLRTALNSPKMHRVIVSAAIRSWKAMGSRRMFSMQFASYKPDVALAIQPESVVEHDHAVTMALAQDMDYAAIAFEHAMRDWSDWIEKCAVPVELISGEYDPVAPISGVLAMAAAYPDKMKVHTIKDAGYMLFFGHTQAIVDVLKTSPR